MFTNRKTVSCILLPEMTAVTSKRSRMEDSGGFTDFPKEAVEVVGPDLQKGFNAVKEKLNKGELFLIPAS